MKIWMKKLTVLLVTIFTLGLYVPPISIDAEVDKLDKSEIEPSENHTNSTEDQEIVIEDNSSEVVVSTEESNRLYLQELNQLAKEQLVEKLGAKIESKVDAKLDEVIFPNLEMVLEHLYAEIGIENSQYLVISEDPSAGFGERIFNLYDAKNKQDVARFHVNRIKKPQDGYFFQFHYHLQTDQFEKHFPFGELYWGKDTPPKWMS